MNAYWMDHLLHYSFLSRHMTDKGYGTLDKLLAEQGMAFVKSCYRELLGRDADPDGLQHHLDLLAKGRSKLKVAASIADSAECRAKGLHNSSLAVSARRRARSKFRIVKDLWNIGGNAGQISQNLERVSESVVLPYLVKRIPYHDWLCSLGDNEVRSDARFNRLWFDLTTCLHWTAGVVGIIRAELEMACHIKKIYPELRYSMQVDRGFVEIDESELRWLLDADNVAEAYMTFFGRNGSRPSHVHVSVPDTADFFHPFGKNDIIFSMGWKDSPKEQLFSELRSETPDIVLSYLIYDVIMMRPETGHFYAKADRDQFEKYLKWISFNCNFLLFGGENTRRDVEQLQRERGWPVVPGRAIRFGSDIVDAPNRLDDKKYLNEMGIDGSFLLAVGTVEPRKNYSTLYRAYLLAQELSAAPLPQLVICGQNGHRVGNLNDTLSRDARVSGRLLRLTPNDQQLSALYRNCVFTLLPSFYEGWSLTLPESFAYGKFCLCADTPPLREVGGELADYVDPIDVSAWAKVMLRYIEDRESLARREQQIAAEWHITTWSNAAQMAFSAITDLNVKHGVGSGALAIVKEPPTIWMDLTLSFLNWNHSLTGVTRVELMYAKTLRQLLPETRFFAYGEPYFFEIDPTHLSWMEDGEDLSKAYDHFHAFWHHHERAGTGFRNPLRGNLIPQDHPAYLASLPSNSIVFCAGIDFGRYNANGEPQLHYTDKIERLIPVGARILRSHFMHDFTPSDWPHVHKLETVEGYEPFCDYVFNKFDYLVYGGLTAQRDGSALQKRKGWQSPPGTPVVLGFDIHTNGSDSTSNSAHNEIEELKRIGISSEYVLAVGTLEPRKNHETLYRAYLLMQNRALLKKPLQMIFVGKPGWNSDDFLTTLAADERVRGKIIVANPSDEGLDTLYRNALFTLLPSFYEGWSLPLPESLAYGKFCLVSDTPPLRERGADFVEYVHPLDAARWAERIATYANNPERLIPWEDRIKRQWKPYTWREATEMLRDVLYSAYENAFGAKAPARIARAPWQHVKEV